MDNNQKTKLTVVMPVWSPIRHELFQAMARQPDIRLKVLFEKGTLEHRPSWKIISNAAYEWEIIDSFHLRFFQRYRLIPYRLPFFLKKDYPDVLLVVCLTQAVIAMLSVYSKKTKVILWTGESDHTLSRRSIPQVVKLLRRTVYPFIDGFGCYSRTTMAFLNQMFNIPTSKLFRIPQCIDNDHFQMHQNTLPAPAHPKGKHIFLIVGQLIPRKGIAQFISAWLKLPQEILTNSILKITGNGPLHKKLKAQAGRAVINSIEFTGFVGFDHLPQLYQQADVLVLPSLEDIWGLVINEAMAAGLPVLCSRYATAREMVGEGKNGFVFDPLVEDDTISTMKKMYEKRNYWAQMGQWGKERIEKQYSVEVSAEAMMHGIGKILNKV